METKRPKIAIGTRVGLLTVTEKTGRKKNGYVVWRCRCDCGGQIELDTRYLQRGTITDCGCRTKVRPRMLDLKGMRFGKLVCMEPLAEKDRFGNAQWLCLCDCGAACVASVHQLRSGYKKSCGCLSHPPLKDYVGKRFGRLTVVEYAGKQDGLHRWRCRCDCGNETVVGQTSLQNGRTKSCGCLQASQIMKNMNFVDGTSVTTLLARKSRPPIASNRSGHNGVYRNRKTGKWTAQIGFKGKTYYLGSYADLSDAVRARKRGEEMYDDFLEWYFSECAEKGKRKNRRTERAAAPRGAAMPARTGTYGPGLSDGTARSPDPP